MFQKKPFFILPVFIFGFLICNAQLEVVYLTFKDFKAFGFGAFFNFIYPVSDANYFILAGGLQYFKDRDEVGVALVPILAGYRYTFDQSGTGFYVEPNAGYGIGGSDLERYDKEGNFILDENGNYTYENPGGLMAGIGLGYLLQPGAGIQLNIGARYERVFTNGSTNVFSFRISHAFTFGRRN